MSLSTSRSLAFLSAFGIAAGIFGYIESFFGAPVDSFVRWGILLFVGQIALFAPIYVLEYPASKSPTFLWHGFSRGMPRWVAPCAQLLTLLAIAHWVLCAFRYGWGVPAIQDGQYVIAARGKILKVVSPAQYVALKEEELRAFATVIVSFYFVPMMYWWFAEKHPQVD
jgi:hypothetical protein